MVRLQYYRGMKVAVKEFLPHSMKSDVVTILSMLNHPNLPYMFGMCTSSLPYRIILQFHGVGFETVTFIKELVNKGTQFRDLAIVL